MSFISAIGAVIFIFFLLFSPCRCSPRDPCHRPSRRFDRTLSCHGGEEFPSQENGCTEADPSLAVIAVPGFIVISLKEKEFFRFFFIDQNIPPGFFTTKHNRSGPNILFHPRDPRRPFPVVLIYPKGRGQILEGQGDAPLS